MKNNRIQIIIESTLQKLTLLSLWTNQASVIVPSCWKHMCGMYFYLFCVLESSKNTNTFFYFQLRKPSHPKYKCSCYGYSYLRGERLDRKENRIIQLWIVNDSLPSHLICMSLFYCFISILYLCVLVDDSVRVTIRLLIIT